MIEWNPAEPNDELATAMRQARDAAIHALQAIAVDWGARPEARTLAELRRAVRGDLALTRRAARADLALARLVALTASRAANLPLGHAATAERSVLTCGDSSRP